MKRSLAAISALLILSACASHHPKMLSFTPASVVVDYSNNSLHEATGLAQQYCSSMQKDAQYVRTEEKGLLTTEKHAYFNCVESLAKAMHNNNQQHGFGANTPIINNFK